MAYESPQTEKPVNYPVRTAIIFCSAHAVFFVLLLIWSLGERMFSSAGANFVLYLIEIPGVVITKAVGQAENLELMAPYIIVLLVNSIVYGLIGFGFGSLFQELGWVDQSHNIFLTEEEISNKDKGIGQAT